MALLSQWVRQRPWLTTGLVGAAGSISGFAHYIATGIGAIGVSKAGVKTRSINHEHPFRYRILRTLESKPGLCYRELQSTMSAANGTLRHHLDVLQAQKSIQAIEVNGRLCYFAGSPQQFEDFRGQTFGLEEVAMRMPVGLSLVQKTVIDHIQKHGTPKSQAYVAREIGRTRASVHSAVKVLRRRGILRQDSLSLSPLFIDSKTWTHQRIIDYEWDDERHSR